MAYTKTTWAKRIVENPDQYEQVYVGGGIYTITPSPGTVTQEGTPLTEVYLNNLETQYDEAYDDLIGLGSAIYGDGSDGDVTIAAPTTLTRDMFYNNLTVNNGITLNPGGFRIFVRGTLTNNGTISGNGNAASGTTEGAALAAGSLGAGAAGGAGQAAGGGGGGGGGRVVFIAAKDIVNTGKIISVNGGAGANGVPAAPAGGDGSAGGNVTASIGGAGGAGGGDTIPHNGGSGGTATAPTAAQGGYRALPFAAMLKDETTEFTGGAGGGGGSASGASGPAAGGGGGGGGLLVLVYTTLATGTESASGGAKGLKSGVGADDGVDGTAGTVIKIVNI